MTVVAKPMPGAYDVEYTSPWAGANVLPSVLHPTVADEAENKTGEDDDDNDDDDAKQQRRMADLAHSRWERDTWPELRRLAAKVPEAGIHFQSKTNYSPQ